MIMQHIYNVTYNKQKETMFMQNIVYALMCIVINNFLKPIMDKIDTHSHQGFARYIN